jgi:KRAB domain-containing zinc finger protein
MCELCGKSFKQRKTLISHTWCHHRTGKKPKKTHLCEICGKNFGSKPLLDDHRNIHTGEKPFKCHWCDKRFRFRTGLDVHQNIHKEKQYICDIGGMKFTQSGSVKRHKGTAHKVAQGKSSVLPEKVLEKQHNSGME